MWVGQQGEKHRADEASEDHEHAQHDVTELEVTGGSAPASALSQGNGRCNEQRRGEAGGGRGNARRGSGRRGSSGST